MVETAIPLRIPQGEVPLPRLSIPTIKATTAKSRPYYRPKTLQAWAEALPIGNTSVASHQFLQRLRSLNTAVYPPKERLALLNTLRALAHNLLAALKQPLRQASLPLDPKEQYTTEFIQTLLAQLASGYKLVVADLSRKPWYKLKEAERMTLQEACYFGIVYLGMQLLETYAVYSPAPPTVWLDLNQLYQFAEARGLHATTIDEPLPDTPLPVQHTVDFAYKRILLLTLAAPYHLMEYEVEDMYRLIAPSAAACQISHLGLHIPQGSYVIDLNQASGPRFISGDTPWQATDGRGIDISSIKAQLDLHLNRILRNNAQSPVLDATTLAERQYRDMLLRLADAWNGRLVRQNPRVQLHGKVQLCSGLNACHYFISGEKEFTPAMDELKLRSHQDQTHHKIFAGVYRDALERDRRHNTKLYALNPWTQRDVSPIGIALNCRDVCADMQTRVGELVTYRFTDSNLHRWRIGVIRRLQYYPNASPQEGQIHIGILNLAIGAVPVGVKGILGVGSESDYFRGLFIPRQVALDQTRALIVPALMYDVNSILAVNMKQRLFYVRLTRMPLTTRGFAQFEFEIVTPPRFALDYPPPP
ncbi:MAG: hypothetical protein HY080_17040 [Gammaproteobacteria bacterium]|nr:hypothetical protein [Gammaproteobacteria bacterium]